LIETNALPLHQTAKPMSCKYAWKGLISFEKYQNFPGGNTPWAPWWEGANPPPTYAQHRGQAPARPGHGSSARFAMLNTNGANA